MSRTTADLRAWTVLAAATATAVLLGTAACAGPAPAPTPAPVPAATVLEPAAIHAGDEWPAPTATPVLTLTGRISSTNADRALSLDPGVLDRLGVLRVSVYEPWVKQNLDFQGVWLADLLATAQADPEARTVHFTALDNYQIDLSMADARADGVFLATRTGAGGPIPIEDGGPTRLVFTGAAGASPDQWIWSLTTIDVR